jgi:hypothetical protein
MSNSFAEMMTKHDYGRVDLHKYNDNPRPIPMAAPSASKNGRLSEWM